MLVAITLTLAGEGARGGAV
jgi:hypothetical protein